MRNNKLVLDVNKRLNNKPVRFIFVGILNTIVGYGTYAVICWTGSSYIIASIVSNIVGVMHSYVWNKLFTFKSTKRSIPEMIRFISVYGVSFVINLGVLAVLIDCFGVNKYVSGIVTLFITTVLSYFGHNHFSFKKGGESQ